MTNSKIKINYEEKFQIQLVCARIDSGKRETDQIMLATEVAIML